jgi:two-component system cell cycle sensor histidine kinase/response regulator CckA
MPLNGEPPNLTRKIKILVAEDELIVAKNIENQLVKIGYEVVATADSGEEAVARAAQTKPDLVLMDIKLAGEMDGVEAARQIYERFHIPAVYLTAYADNETLHRAKLTDPYGYVIKPFEPKKLHTAIEIALYKHQMQKKLKESELRFRTLASFAPVGIFQTDCDNKCIYVNERWCEIAGLSPEQARGKGWIESLHPDDRATMIDNWSQMVRSGSQFTQEYRFRTPSGKITWVHGCAAPLKSDSGEKIGYIGSITDITLRKELEEKFLTGKKLESIGILAGGIAHDFNNLLSVILGNISMLKGDPNITADQFNMLKNAEKASTQAAELAQKLITFSRGGWLDRKEFDFSQLLQEIIQQQFHQQESWFDLHIPHQLPAVNGDRTQLKQVFTNLLLNAIEAGEAHKEGITIGAEKVDKHRDETTLTKNRYVKVTIKDRGGGIPKEHLDKVFDPYFTTKSRGSQKGLGLGLAICYSIIQKHGGHIQVNSETGKGTTVEVYLPTSQVPVDTPVFHRETPPAPACKVLVMDDEEIIRDVTRQMLSRLKYRVETFDDGWQAVKAFEEARKAGEPFDVALLDLFNKKGLGGKDTLNKLLQLDPHVKAVAISGFSDGSDWDTLKKLGFLDILFKPYRLDDLKNLLGKINRAETRTNSSH